MIIAVQGANADRGDANEHLRLLLIATDLRPRIGIEDGNGVVRSIAEYRQQSVAEGHRTTGAIAKFEGFEPGREH